VKPLSASQRELLEVARAHPGIGKSEAATRIGIRPKGAGVDVFELRKMGLLQPATAPEDPRYGQLWPVEVAP
jgi:hypothetical protein